MWAKNTAQILEDTLSSGFDTVFWRGSLAMALTAIATHSTAGHHYLWVHCSSVSAHILIRAHAPISGAGDCRLFTSELCMQLPIAGDGSYYEQKPSTDTRLASAPHTNVPWTISPRKGHIGVDLTSLHHRKHTARLRQTLARILWFVAFVLRRSQGGSSARRTAG